MVGDFFSDMTFDPQLLILIRFLKPHPQKIPTFSATGRSTVVN